MTASAALALTSCTSRSRVRPDEARRSRREGRRAACPRAVGMNPAAPGVATERALVDGALVIGTK
jgi:hypothetical protein